LGHHRGPDPAQAPDAQADAGLLVPLAGLVLLHPYLPRLLAACGLYTAGQRMLAPEHLPRACAVLRALADARAQVLEHELPFVKLLLGAAPDEPLPNALPASPPASMQVPALLPSARPEPSTPTPALTPALNPALYPALIPALAAAEREEVAAVLEAARSHWSALRGTSVEGLRSSFLQRRGLLERADGAWRLRLQTEPWDMLVALLPWSIGFVKLPWMAQPLVVEWPTP
jgi:hypothetical protein